MDASTGKLAVTSPNPSSSSCSYNTADTNFDVQNLLDVQALVQFHPRYSHEVRDFMDNVLKYIHSMTKFMAELGFSEDDEDDDDENIDELRVKGKAAVEADYSFKLKASYFSLINRNFLEAVSFSLKGVVEAFYELDHAILRPCVENIFNCYDDVSSLMAENFGYKDDQLGLVRPQPLVLDHSCSSNAENDGFSFSGRQIHHIILVVHRMSENLPRYVLEMSKLLNKVRKLKYKANKIKAKSGLQMHICQI